MKGDIRINWFEGGGGIARATATGWDLFEVPQYGGEERYVGHFATLEEAKAVAEKWP